MVFDTNVLIYAADDGGTYQEHCYRFLEQFVDGQEIGYIPWNVCYEFLRVSTHPRVFGRPLTPELAWDFLDRLLTSPGFRPLVATDRHAATLSQVLSELPTVPSNQMHDLHIAVLMRERGLSRISTRDRGFRRFPFLEVIDPLADMTGV